MPEAPLIALAFERSSAKPLFQQVYEVRRQRIVDGHLAVGGRLPATRRFAEELGVSRATIVTAYEQLVAEGYVDGRIGSGYYVSPLGEVELTSGNDTAAKKETEVAPSTAPTAPLPFQPGQPDMRLFPYRRWAQCVSRIARSAPRAMIAADHPFGDGRLRHAIAGHLAEWRGVRVGPQRILITAGSGDALEICIRTLVGSGGRIALEDPGYGPLRNFAGSLGVIPEWLDRGPNGVELPADGPAGRASKLAILTPSHQFPLGGAIPANRRMEFLRWAERADGWIIEDDYDSEFRYAGRPIPALASFDQSDRTIYVGSFSKIFSSGLRLGFLAAPAALIPQFMRTLAAFGTKASIAPQRALAAFMEDGEFYRHIRRVRRTYGDRRRTLLERVQADLGHLVRFEDHQAGMHVVLQLPAGYDDVAISDAAARQGIVAPALSTYYSGAPLSRGLVLGFCAFTADETERGIGVLRESIEALAPEPR
jgi:GntR family transcriptional regulator/MocR family aminotransferase